MALGFSSARRAQESDVPSNESSPSPGRVHIFLLKLPRHFRPILYRSFVLGNHYWSCGVRYARVLSCTMENDFCKLEGKETLRGHQFIPHDGYVGYSFYASDQRSICPGRCEL